MIKINISAGIMMDFALFYEDFTMPLKKGLYLICIEILCKRLCD